MNKFVKYCPKVWIVKSDELYEKGDIIEVQTGRGRFVEREIFKRLGEKNGSLLYSVIPTVKSFAEKKAEKYEEFAQMAEERATVWNEKSQEGRDFLALAEPIKIGHQREAEYWRRKKEEINLSMPESLEHFKYELEKAQQKYEGMKNGTIEREHSMSLSYARNKVKKLEKNLEIAKFLWEAGDDDSI